MSQQDIQAVEVAQQVVEPHIRQLGLNAATGKVALRHIAERCIDALSRRSTIEELRRVADYALERERQVIDGKWDHIDTEQLVPAKRDKNPCHGD